MTGKQNRSKGHRWERDLASWFSAAGFGDIRTGRSVTGGTQQGADLVTVEPDGAVLLSVGGWSIEAKDCATPAVPAWLRQAHSDADGIPYAVVHKRRGRPVHEATVHMTRECADLLTDCFLPAGVDRTSQCLATFTTRLIDQRVREVDA